MTVQPSEPDFDRVADVYRWAEYLALGSLLQRTRLHFLPMLSGCRSALVLGDGDGRFLAQLLAANKGLNALAVDSSARMLTLLQRRCRFAAGRLQTLQTSAVTAIPATETDLVVTHFFLDCLNQSEADQLIHQTAEHCHPGTLWLISDFQVPERRWLRWAGRAYIQSLYFAFRILTGLRVRQLPDTHSLFIREGFTRVAYHQRLGGLIYTELWRFDGNVE